MLDYNSPAVQSSLTILQDVIARMAANSASAKTWCIALVSAILVLLTDRPVPALIIIALVPVLLFCLLDTYYLALEKDFRDRYNDLVDKIHEGKAELHDMFVVLPPGHKPPTRQSASNALTSLAIWPFYTILILLLIVVWLVVIIWFPPPA